MSCSAMQTNVMCRIERNVALYNTPTDIKPNTSKILLAGTIFISTKYCKIGNIKLYYIDGFITGPIEDLSGYWCPDNNLTINIVEQGISGSTSSNITTDDSSDINKTLTVTGNNIIIYQTATGNNIVKNTLSLGDVIHCDKMIHVNYNGKIETRYHINMPEDSTYNINGYWILVNNAVTEMSKTSHRLMSMAFSSTSNIVSSIFIPVNPVDLINKAKAQSTDSRSKNDRNGSAPGTSAVTVQTPNLASQNSTSANTYNNDNTGQLTSDTNIDTTANADEEEDLSGNDQYAINEINLDSSALYDKYGFNYYYSTMTTIMNVPLGRLLFVHGMPFQYTYITDRRGGALDNYGKIDESPDNKVTTGDSDLYGRIFAKEIVANMPIAVIVPGKADFLTRVRKSIFGYTSGTSQSIKNNWLPLFSDSVTSEQEEEAINDLMSDKKNADYDYFSFVVDTDEYYKYVNSLCRTSARLMGLSNVSYRNKKCTAFDWGGYNTAADQDYTAMQEVVGLANSVSFAYDPLSSVSDTISNSTGDSQFSTMFNSISSKARELNFVAGTVTGADIGIGNADDYQGAVTAAAGSNLMSHAGTPFHRFGAWLKNVGSGLNVRFPEIWQDSSNSRSYDMDMKFVTPYATMFCKWRYVLVPFFHIFALAAPQSPNTIMAYKSPFLIRAFSKGYFNVELGIIETLTWKRFGDGDMISADGIPTEIDVSIGFKDLYHTLAMSKTSDLLEGIDSVDEIKVFFNNTGLMDLIGTLSGVNMNRITFGERLALYTGAMGSTFSSTGPNFMRHFSDRVRNVVERYFVGI